MLKKIVFYGFFYEKSKKTLASMNDFLYVLRRAQVVELVDTLS